MPCPYNIILGRETALPSPLYHSGVTGIDLKSGNHGEPPQPPQGGIPTEMKVDLILVLIVAIVDRPTADSIN